MKKIPILLIILTLNVGLGAVALPSTVVNATGEVGAGSENVDEAGTEVDEELLAAQEAVLRELQQDWLLVQKRYGTGYYPSMGQELNSVWAIADRIKELRESLALVHGATGLRAEVNGLRTELKAFCVARGIYTPDMGPDDLPTVDDLPETDDGTETDPGVDPEQPEPGDETETDPEQPEPTPPTGVIPGEADPEIPKEPGDGDGTGELEKPGNNDVAQVTRPGVQNPSQNTPEASGEASEMVGNFGAGWDSTSSSEWAYWAPQVALGGAENGIEELGAGGVASDGEEGVDEQLASPEGNLAGFDEDDELAVPRLGEAKQGWPWWIWLIPGAMIILLFLVVRRCWQRD